MRKSIALSAFLLLIAVADGQSIFEEHSLELFRQNAREARSGRRYAFLALYPGTEDVTEIARARFELGARVILVYLTNGEGVRDGLVPQFPNQIAARRRGAAFALAQTVGADHAFMNLPYIDAASTMEGVRREWEADTVQARWSAILGDFKPDGVLVSGLERYPEGHPIRQVVLEDLNAVAKRATRTRGWRAIQIAIAKSSKEVTAKQGSYASRAFSASWPGERHRKHTTFTYGRMNADGSVSGKRLTQRELFPNRGVPAQLAPIDSAIRRFSTSLEKMRSIPGGRSARSRLKELVDVMTRIDMEIARTMSTEVEMRRFLLDWKLPLDILKAELLGVRVAWTLSDTTLTERQLTYLRVDSLRGLSKSGVTEIFFPSVLNGWILNETTVNHLPLNVGEEYRLISPTQLAFDLPRSLNGLFKTRYRDPWYFFVVHRGATAEESFGYRISVPMTFAPRFTAEVLTPAVKVQNGEQVVFELANYSRDGVRDVVHVRDERVQSSLSPFRLMSKGQRHRDTLTLSWSDSVEYGTHLMELLIGSDPVTNFIARKFDITIDSTLDLKIVAQSRYSPLAVGLRRLGAAPEIVEPDEIMGLKADDGSILIVDEDLSLFRPLPSRFWDDIRSYTSSGGTVLLLQQEGADLERSGLFPNATFVRSYGLDTAAALSAPADSRILDTPYDLTEETWDGWIFRVAKHVIGVPPGNHEVLLSLKSKNNPALIRTSIGKGSVVYCDVNLSPQFQNLLPSAFALMANILSNVSHEH